MKIVRLKGGLGNQMFQYAFAKLVEKKTNDVVKLDLSAYNDLSDDTVRVPRIAKFNLSLNFATNDDIESLCKIKHRGNSLSFWYKVKIYLESKINKKYYFESNRAYVWPEKILSYDYFDGYWQSYKYVDEIAEALISDFTPNYELSEKTQKTGKQMREQNSVFVGVRKGDYTSNKATVLHYGSFSSEYYEKAMRIIEDKVKDPVFYVFSNDIDWCKENINWGDRKIIFREPEEQTDDFEELMLMRSCKHAIMVNSTFHWWGAYLIDNPEKIIICPQKWFFDNKPIDITPSYWISI